MPIIPGTPDGASQLRAMLQTSVEEHAAPVDELIQVRDTQPVHDLHAAMKTVLDACNVVKTVQITNRAEERQRFKRAQQEDASFQPNFVFQEPPWAPRTVNRVLDTLQDATELIDDQTLEQFRATHITVEEFRSLFTETFEEFKLYVRLASHAEDRDSWKQTSLQLWPMVDESLVRRAEALLADGYQEEIEEKTLDPAAVKTLWERELRELGVDWNVEIRDVAGCFNIPEEQTVVVARGAATERRYSATEAARLTKHELFHVVRAYNGLKVGERSGLPPFLGLHTPFYDKTEEGGAIFREYATGVISDAVEHDYAVKLLVAAYTAQDVPFQEIVERLTGFGVGVDRAFFLAARNRELLRHHIYLGGYYEEWEGREEVAPLLLGKVNSEVAALLWNEVDGMLDRPPVGADALFTASAE